VGEEHLGRPCSQNDLKRQLALKEQDLLYAKQRVEKKTTEASNLKKELQELRNTPDSEEKNTLLDCIE
jgi:hypothetical protein